MPDLLYRVESDVATLTFNRPDRLNAISGEMLREFGERLREADADPGVRAIVLTGAGRGFCAGLDLKDVAAGEGNLGEGAEASALSLGDSPPAVLHRIDTPTLCALNGPASGYGMDLALGCDLRLASDRALFAPPVGRGLVPESGGTWILPRLVGWARACEVTLLGRRLGAEELRELGLVNRVVPHDELLSETYAWAAELAANPPLAVRAAKRSMRLGLDEGFEANIHHAMAELLKLFRTRDFREGAAVATQGPDQDDEILYRTGHHGPDDDPEKPR